MKLLAANEARVAERPFTMQRLGMIMEPQRRNPLEIEGVLNPAAVRGRDGDLYIFPRLVANGNYSRIGIARVQFDRNGNPFRLDRLGVVLEPEADYERRSNGVGGCEDPRITFVEPLKEYVMTYTALTADGPRIAIAIAENLFRWRRLGLAVFDPHGSICFQGVDNKDAAMFPEAFADPDGRLSLAILQRPLFQGTRPEEKVGEPMASDVHRESIWISYGAMPVDPQNPSQLCHFSTHARLAAPVAPWEQLKIGAGTPPILCRHGWLVVYHGVSDVSQPGDGHCHLSYSAGVMVLDRLDPSRILYRSDSPVLTPELPYERIGAVADVVFPTGIDRRDDLGMPDRFDVYYGMADNRIGVARLDVPEHLPSAPEPSSSRVPR